MHNERGTVLFVIKIFVSFHSTAAAAIKSNTQHRTFLHFILNFHNFPFSPFSFYFILFFNIATEFHLMRGVKNSFRAFYVLPFSVRLNLMVAVVVLVHISLNTSSVCVCTWKNPFGRFIANFHRLKSKFLSRVSLKRCRNAATTPFMLISKR